MEKAGMPYRSLGKCGTHVSTFGLGGWTTFGDSVSDRAAVRSILTAAIEAGINFFDIADVYARGKSEERMGEVLRELPRHELVISTKVFFPMSDEPNDRGLSRKHIMESIDRSLKRIGIDYIDIYFCHRYDENTPLEETARAMDDLVRRGKVLYWGTSQWTGRQIDAAHEIADRRNLYGPQVEQPQYSLIHRGRFDRDTLPAVERHGMGTVVWSPLASGLLTGKYDQGVPKGTRLSRIDWLREDVLTDERVDRVRRFADVAKGLGCSRAQAALSWVSNRPGVSSVILGCTSVEQLHENLSALKVAWSPDAEQAVDRLFPIESART